MKAFFNHFKPLGTHWVPRALATAIILLAFIQVVFMGIQSQIAQKAEIAGRSVINGSNRSLNPYYFSQAVSGLELGNLLSCVEIRKAGQAIPFYESTPEHCEKKSSYAFLLNGEERKAVVKSASGEEWELKFRAVNGALFSFALWALRISALFFTFIFFLWAEWRVKAAARLQEANKRAAEELAHFATQVAHDIRSPLATLNVLINPSAPNPDDSRHILKEVIQRINDIANSLLEKEKDLAKVTAVAPKDLSAPGDIVVAPALIRLVKEKEIEFRARKGLAIHLDLDTADGICIRGEPTDFSRALSNLINNAAEAIGNRPGKIAVRLRTTQKNISISIIDNGPGIPEDILPKVGERGFSFGKGGRGSGLGIFQAKTVIKGMDGNLAVASGPEGTEISILLPRASAPPRSAVLLDDDVSLHFAWQLAARARDISLRCFSTVAELRAGLHLIPRTADFYIDSLLDNETVKGEAVAKEIYDQGYRNLSLCTGLPASSFPRMPWIKKITGKEPPWL